MITVGQVVVIVATYGRGVLWRTPNTKDNDVLGLIGRDGGLLLVLDRRGIWLQVFVAWLGAIGWVDERVCEVVV